MDALEHHKQLESTHFGEKGEVGRGLYLLCENGLAVQLALPEMPTPLTTLPLDAASAF